MAGSLNLESNILLAGKNKMGLIKPDDEGYYDMVLGAIDTTNKSGDYYDPHSGRKALEDPDLRQLSDAGNLRGEYGHPKRMAGETDDQLGMRCLNVAEERTSHHMYGVHIDDKSIEDDTGRIVPAFRSKLCPSGEKGDVLEKQMKRKSENVCFSVRSFTNNYWVVDHWEKEFTKIITWDYVNDPGIAVATKYHSPSLESAQHRLARSGTQVKITPQLIENVQRLEKAKGLSMESSKTMSRMLSTTEGYQQAQVLPASMRL